MAKMTWELMLQKYQRLLKSKERKIYANYKQSYRQLEKDFRAIYADVESNFNPDLDYQMSIDDWNRQLLNTRTASAMQELYLNNTRLLRATFDEILDTTRDRSIQAIGGKERIIGITKTLDRASIIDKSIAGVDWAERIAHGAGNLRYDLVNITAGGIEQGLSYTKIAEKIAGKYAMETRRTIAIARTEGHRIYETTKYETMSSVNDEIGLHKSWHCVRDERARHNHVMLDAVQVPFDELFTSPSGAQASRPGEFGDPAEDINCRCWLSYEIKEKHETPRRRPEERDKTV